MEDAQQPVRAQNQRVAVSQKDPAHTVPVVGISQRHLPGNFFIGQDLEGHAPVHVAVGTFIVGAAPGHPQDKTVGFAGRTEHRGIVIVKKQRNVLSC